MTGLILEASFGVPYGRRGSTAPFWRCELVESPMVGPTHHPFLVFVPVWKAKR